jgi:hypothetical protein
MPEVLIDGDVLLLFSTQHLSGFADNFDDKVRDKGGGFLLTYFTSLLPSLAYDRACHNSIIPRYLIRIYVIDPSS